MEKNKKYIVAILTIIKSKGYWKFDFIYNSREKYSIKNACRYLKVSESGYYKYIKCCRSNNIKKHEILLVQIQECLKIEPENSNYGINRIFLWLQINKDYKGSKRNIYHICKENNLLIKNKFNTKGITKVDEPNKKGLTDITEISCKNDEKLYLSAYLDCFNGSILAYEMDINMKVELCVNNIKRVFKNEKPKELIVHSDHLSQYTSNLFRLELKNMEQFKVWMELVVATITPVWRVFLLR